MEPIEVLTKKPFRHGTSRAVILPAWWLGDTKAVRMEVYEDKIIITKTTVAKKLQ